MKCQYVLMKTSVTSLTIDSPHDDTSKLSNDEQSAKGIRVLLKMCDRESETSLILELDPRNLDTESNSIC